LEAEARKTQRMIAKGIAWGGLPRSAADRAELKARWMRAQKVLDRS
jgi:hypothetical protein